MPADEARLAVPSFADDVAAPCDALALRGAVLVGHSFGAAVAVELAERRPDLIAAVVALDGALPFPPELLDETADLLAALRTPGWREAIRGLVSSTFLPTDKDPLARMLADIDRLPQHVVAGVPEQALAWDAEAAVGALGDLGTPVLAISAEGPPLCDLERFAKLAPLLVTGKVVAMDHDQMLATPAQCAAMIERFLATAVA